jgi:hypothetical protein
VFSLVIALIVIDPFNFRDDGSLLSKILFLESVYNILTSASWSEWLFGFGASYEVIVARVDVDGLSPHIPFLKAILYFGLIGLLLYLITHIYVIYKDKDMTIPVIVFFILSLAGSPIFWPTLSVGLIVLIISKQNLRPGKLLRPVNWRLLINSRLRKTV